MRLLAPLEPEPMPDPAILRESFRTHIPPLTHLWCVAVKKVEWQRRQRWWKRLARGLFG